LWQEEPYLVAGVYTLVTPLCAMLAGVNTLGDFAV